MSAAMGKKRCCVSLLHLRLRLYKMERVGWVAESLAFLL